MPNGMTKSYYLVSFHSGSSFKEVFVSSLCLCHMFLSDAGEWECSLPKVPQLINWRGVSYPM